MVGSHPAILRGLLTRLAGEPPEVTKAVLSGPVGARLKREDLAGHPELAELWLVQSVASGSMQPLPPSTRSWTSAPRRGGHRGSTRRCCACCGRAAARRDQLAELVGISG